MTDPLDRGHEARNDASRAQLLALVDGLTEADLARDEGGWTLGTNLAHLAFWDRLVLLRWQEAAASGREVPVSVGSPLFDLINDAAAHEWRRLDLPAIRELVRSAAQDVDAYIAALPDDRVAAAIAAGLTRNLDRSVHRGLHLEPVEVAPGG